MLNPYVVSLIRTVVPMIVGYLLSIPAVAWILNAVGVPNSDRGTWLARGVAFALAFAYYAAVRALERKWPQLGVLLGVPAQPVYAKQSAIAAADVAHPDAGPADPLAGDIDLQTKDPQV